MRFTVKELEVILHLVSQAKEHPALVSSPSFPKKAEDSALDKLDNIERKAKAEIAIRTLKLRPAVEADE